MPLFVFRRVVVYFRGLQNLTVDTKVDTKRPKCHSLTITVNVRGAPRTKIWPSRPKYPNFQKCAQKLCNVNLRQCQELHLNCLMMPWRRKIDFGRGFCWLILLTSYSPGILYAGWLPPEQPRRRPEPYRRAGEHTQEQHRPRRRRQGGNSIA